ncbi:ribonuclease H-like domain-containing protein [Tanacetum coccineum]|uniref:Ribonuclease H-like domain-containing protein n=1 Tax=Tanacetum coccineum TaxID=301880 RepID=A0ABQ5H6F0_9ASTR
MYVCFSCLVGVVLLVKDCRMINRYSYLTTENSCFTTELNKALYDNDTWEITDLPKDRKSIGGKWVFKIKYKSSGEIEIYKARYVVKGYNQKEGIDFDETFSPVVKIMTVRCLINLDVQNSWPLFQLDINNAFLYGDLSETVLKQAPMQWNAKLIHTLVKNGFIQSKSDYSVFTKSEKGNFVALLVYVDDIIITRNKVDEIEKFKSFLITKFQIKDLGKLKYFLGIEAVETSNGICLSQRKYCLDLLSEFGLLACKPFTIHLEHDIAYSVHCLSQFMHKPLKSHIKIALKVLKYCPGKDVLTKGLDKVQHEKLVLKMGLVDVFQAKVKRGCFYLCAVFGKLVKDGGLIVSTLKSVAAIKRNL